MKRRGVIRRVVLPTIWVVIGVLIAASLVKLAFLGGSASARGDDPLKPTGEVPAETVPVEVGDVSNKLTIEGTIALDPAKAALAPVDGELSHIYLLEGIRVEAGAPLFQVRTEKEPAAEEPVDEGEPGARRPVRRAPSGPQYSYTTVTAPTSGRISAWAFAIGDPVSKGASVVSVQPATFKAVGDVTPLDRYRLLDQPDHARVTIKGGPKPFRCRGLTVGDAATAAAPSNGEEGGMEGEPGGEPGAATSVSCRVPPWVTVFDGLTMTMKIPAGVANDVLVVPVTAVRGLLGSGTVWVIGEDGAEKKREIGLGITDGKVVEVTSGLKKGETLLRYVPGAAPEDAPMEGEMMYG